MRWMQETCTRQNYLSFNLPTQYSEENKEELTRLQSANLKCNSSLNSHEEDEANWKLERELKEQ